MPVSVWIFIQSYPFCPGLTATNATDHYGEHTPEQAAKIAIKFALLDDEGPTGTFHNDAGSIQW
jgi:hypothetical protein